MRYILSIFVLLCLLSPASATLEGHWKFQDNEANTDVDESSGNSTNGTLSTSTTDAITTTGPGTLLTRAFDFNNTAPYVGVTGDADFPDLAEVLTLCFWMNADSFSASTGDPMIQYANGGSNGNDLTVYAEANAVSVGFQGHRIKSTTTTLSTGTWYHVAIVVPSGATTTADVDIYIDGTIQSLTDAAGSSQTLSLTAEDELQYGVSGANFMDGKLCDVRIYDTDESANLATIMAEKDTPSGSAVPIIVQQLNRTK